MEPHKSTERTRNNKALNRFAVVDVETTGGHASKHRITEIGIVIIEDGEIIDTYESFVNPQTSIPLHITTLTGITNQDVENAPVFEEIADEIKSILDNRIFVAQNVNFDYSFIKNEFERIGIAFKAKRLCTSRYARSRINGLRRSSLRVLAEHFNVVNENPHRALSDALTAAKILQSLMAIDENLEIAKKLINRQETKVTLPNHTHPDDYKQLPSKPGVYLFYGEAGKPIYIGKAKNIKSRVSSHFNGDLSSKRTQAFMREIYSIDFIETGSELLAYLVEDSLIRKNWPKHNSAQKARVKKFGVISYLDQNRNYRLAVNPIRQNETAIKVFYYYSAAMQWLHEITVDYQLNPNYVGLLSLAASIEVGDKDHNERVLKLTQDFERSSNAVLLKLRGRSNKEDAWLLVENNSAAAYCFSEKGVVPEKEEMTLLMASATSEKILENYILKNPVNIYNFENEKINSL